MNSKTEGFLAPPLTEQREKKTKQKKMIK